MAIFDNFPYTNVHDLNTDWLVKTVKEVKDKTDTVDDAVSKSAEYQAECKDLRDETLQFRNETEGFKNMVEDDTNDLYQKVSQNTADIRVNTARIDSFASLPAGSTAGNAELLDIRVSADGITYNSAGDAVRGQVDILTKFNQYTNSGRMKFSSTDLESGYYYSTTDGIKTASATYQCTRTLIPVTFERAQIGISTCGKNVYVAQYDANGVFTSGFTLRLPTRAVVPVTFKTTTKFIGLSVNDLAITEISFEILPDLDIIKDPYNDYMPDYITGYLMNSNGSSFNAGSNYNCGFLNIGTNRKFYTNQKLQHNFVAYDENGTVVAVPFANKEKSGRVYEIPSNARFIAININTNYQHGTGSVIVSKITKENVLCIGDSITYLDGDTSGSYDGSNRFYGYQKQLELAGYEVESAGYNGYTLAVGNYNSIYTKIVTDNYDVSGYDIIIIEGGTNDDLYREPIGVTPTDYVATYDVTTTKGALCGIIEYIRTHNNTARIFLVTPLKSQSANRPYNESVLYQQAIIDIANYASCEIIDAYRDMNVQPFSAGWSDFFYDSTHPNRKGMMRLGDLIVKKL